MAQLTNSGAAQSIKVGGSIVTVPAADLGTVRLLELLHAVSLNDATAGVWLPVSAVFWFEASTPTAPLSQDPGGVVVNEPITSAQVGAGIQQSNWVAAERPQMLFSVDGALLIGTANGGIVIPSTSAVTLLRSTCRIAQEPVFVRCAVRAKIPAAETATVVVTIGGKSATFLLTAADDGAIKTSIQL